MLHETAVSWIRLLLARSVPAKAWEETREQYTARLKAVCRDINDNLEVEALCRALPTRIDKLVDFFCGARVTENFASPGNSKQSPWPH